MKWSILLIIFILGLIIAAWWLPMPYFNSPNVEIRGAMDIGSGSTNLKVAKVDPQTDKIITVLFDQSIPVPYQKHLEKSSDNTFDPEVMSQGIKAIKELKEKAHNFQVKKIVAVATAAFRKAANASQFARDIEKETGIKVLIIDQDEEGILAFRGALAQKPIDPQQAVVWDIGGGSMQFTTLTPAGSYFIDKGKLASIPFKNAIIEQVKNQSIHNIHSPNPLNQEEMKKSLAIAIAASQSTNSFVKEKLSNPSSHVLGVGSLFNYGVVPLVNTTQVYKENLASAVSKLVNKGDAELGKEPLAEVAVSNPLLVVGYMEGLHVNKVEVLKVNNADGALTNPPYWEE